MPPSVSCLPGDPTGTSPEPWGLVGVFLFLALGNLILSLKGQKELHSQRWGCPVPTLPGCQRPRQSQLTPFSPPRVTR